MIEVTLKFDTVAEALAALSQFEVDSGDAEAFTLTPTKPKRTRGRPAGKSDAAQTTVTAPVAETAAPDAPVAANPLDVMAGLAPQTAQTAIAPLTKPAVTPATVGQKDVIAAFVKLGQTKGPAAMKGVLDAMGAATVTAIPSEQWALAIQACATA